ncbi:uncharacterized protein LOC126895463 [Daktulosphaira vitifoliae]|uniref:uncharacterized protein LOC126895463 n=1 Tax=Daktulosphaira vitifoliae TaxID=58002 RepID=UPI0021A9C1C9|nr:uncharacterized protein LOC126895463 [Daktulosphaira vitifoliae]
MDKHTSKKRSSDVLNIIHDDDVSFKKIKPHHLEGQTLNEFFEGMNDYEEISYKWSLISLIVYELLIIIRNNSHKTSTEIPQNEQKKNVDNHQFSNNTENPTILSNKSDSTKKQKYSKSKKFLSDMDILKAVNADKMTSFKYTVENSILNLKEFDVFINKTSDILLQSEKIQECEKLKDNVNCQNITKPSKLNCEKQQELVNHQIICSSKKADKNNHVVKLPKKNTNVLLNLLLEENSNSKPSHNSKLLNYLKSQCDLDIRGLNIPGSKPLSCPCNYCIFVDNLPKNDSIAYNFVSKMNNKTYNSNISIDSNHYNLHNNNFPIENTSKLECNICACNNISGMRNNCPCANTRPSTNYHNQSDYIKNSNKAWVDDLTLLIKQNRFMYEIREENTIYDSIESYINISEIMSEVYKAAEKIKSHLPLCKICGKSKPSYLSECDCSTNNAETFNYIINQNECYSPNSFYNDYQY